MLSMTLALALLQGPKMPTLTVPDGWGVNIHFTDEKPGELSKLAGPFRWIRMDFFWAGMEKKPGEYDFSSYDRLLAALQTHNVRPYFILDYGNELYDKDSPRTPESRAAFCRWVEAALRHFAGKGIVWEMWNEPNGGFWKPKANVEEYIALAKEVGETFKRVAPQEILVGPATSGFDWKFLQRCLDAGLLNYWSAVSVHPYRTIEPETVVPDWLRLRAMIARAAPGRDVPMLGGEWGYSELYPGQTKERQAQYMVREYLTDLSCGVPVTIFYDWKDDGVDPKETEHHFGTLLPNLDPKPAFQAAEKLSRDLGGYTYVTRLHTDDPHQWLLLFRQGGQAKVAAWTTGEPSTAELPGQKVKLQPAPQVVAGDSLAQLLDWSPQPWAQTSPAAIDGHTTEARNERTFGKVRLSQVTQSVAERPLNLTFEMERDGSLAAVLENPYGRQIKSGRLFQSPPGTPPAMPTILNGGTPLPLHLRISPDAKRVSAEIDGEFLTVEVPRFVPISLEGVSAAADGDAKIRGTVEAESLPEGVRLNYDFDPGWRFAELRPTSGDAIEGEPQRFGLWVEGNGSGDLLRMRYTDATGQTFQPEFGDIDWAGWRYVSVPIDGSGSHWGGANDGKVHFPVKLTTIALVDMPGGRGGKGSLTVARPAFSYKP